MRLVHRPRTTDARAARWIELEPFMAMWPSALDRAFLPPADFGSESALYALVGSVAVVDVVGPLTQRATWLFDGYDAVRARFSAALSAREVMAIVLRLASPGGHVAGCFEAVRAMRLEKAAVGKPVFAFADEHAFSAAYALACVADKIFVPPEGGLGSIGVLGVLEDRTEANALAGERVVVIASGSEKADGHPDAPVSDEAIARATARIGELADAFARLVADARELSPEQVLGFNAGCFYGNGAVTAGLADGVLSFDECLRAAAGAAPSLSPQAARARGVIMTKERTSAAQGELLEMGHTDFALAAGLTHDAARGETLAAISQVRVRLQGLVMDIGAKSADEAHGIVAALRERARVADEASAELTALRTKAERAEAETLVATAIREGKVVADAGAKVLGLYDRYGMAGLAAHLELLPAQAALSRPAPTPAATPARGAPSSFATPTALSPEDEKLIVRHRLDREKFIEIRKREALDEQAAREQAER